MPHKVNYWFTPSGLYNPLPGMTNEIFVPYGIRLSIGTGEICRWIIKSFPLGLACHNDEQRVDHLKMEYCEEPK
jgi:hypothetical protein